MTTQSLGRGHGTLPRTVTMSPYFVSSPPEVSSEAEQRKHDAKGNTTQLYGDFNLYEDVKIQLGDAYIEK
jgi:hypothetical protein